MVSTFVGGKATSAEGLFAFEQQLISGLIKNRQTTEHWEKRKREHEEVLSNLEFYSQKMKHPIFAPIGKKAMMRANLVHTNEITVSLGLGWFVKVSSSGAVEICRRRIAQCEEMLKKCEAERILYESRRDAKLRSEAFGCEEIVEKYEEEEEEKWRVEHREKVRQHKQQLRDVKDQLKLSSTQTEDELWKHLEMLELQEELEDELLRMGEEEDDDSEDSGETSEEDTTGTKEEKHVRFEPVAAIIEPPKEPEKPTQLIQTTAVKDEILEVQPVMEVNTTKSSRPASKFKKSRQGNAV
ncbi:Prefoldin subunit [Nesidiocoris tenuis]|uniref:Prefoldin subunit n=1 Tax=Nesidiocoris tenuis TaxID=355587 RepID=A0ABN7BIB4_9HEMI|nr:Prefoldin subunit [Nesidiocoris tenuis]